MFDPTAFDNIKVVLEGALYDLDLSGEILINDRNDVINTAKLSRRFDLTFSLPERKADELSAKLILESQLENLAAELLADSLSERLAGGCIVLEFNLQNQHKIMDYNAIERILLDIWGDSRKITLTSSFNPLEDRTLKSVASIEFGRLIREDNMDDLVEMIDVMIATLTRLHSHIEQI